ncbi:MAG: hypothetical protein JWP65_2763 [Ramlibacter sp.]|uniref:hypothetical protein n=1 Tax=Ramlibacter sp. TaxID=1917967 RepID=UPI002603B632|nr:hypothetical protein [Ramlibacter sp.]MDB5752342.1 hypothetical protein [Ramlibacter sp.]
MSGDRPPGTRGEEIFKTVLQVLAILMLAGICLMVLHKGCADITALAREHPGDGFWGALARQLFRNIGG